MRPKSGTRASDRYAKIIDRLRADVDNASVQDLLFMISREYDLQHIAYLGFNFPGRFKKLPVTALTYPDAWVNRYIDADFLKHDPVLKVGLSSLIPFTWNDIDVGAPRHRQIFGEAREFGISSQGITFPVRGQSGDRALISITLSESTHAWHRKSLYLIRDFQILSHHIHAAALRDQKVITNRVKLAPREIEVLQWAAMGKTSSETADILGIKDRTSRFYLELARHKLGAVNVTNAVAKAISLNLISVTL